MPFDANCRSLEKFANEVLPEFVDHQDERERKTARLAPAIETAMRRKEYRPMPDEIPEVAAYGHSSHAPITEDIALEHATSDDTKGALGIASDVDGRP